jgi:hypothetical protein
VLNDPGGICKIGHLSRLTGGAELWRL